MERKKNYGYGKKERKSKAKPQPCLDCTGWPGMMDGIRFKPGKAVGEKDGGKKKWTTKRKLAGKRWPRPR